MTKNKWCSIWWCKREAYASGLCMLHYRSKERNGSVRLSYDTRALLDHTEQVHAVLKTIIKAVDQHCPCCPCCGALDGHEEGCAISSARALLPEKER